MKRIVVSWGLIFIFLFVFVSLHSKTYNDNIKNHNNIIRVYDEEEQQSHICRIVEETNALEINIIVAVLTLCLIIFFYRHLEVHNAKHTYHRKKHIKHLPRADILNPGIII